MATVYRDALTDELVIRLAGTSLVVDARDMVAKIETEIMKFLVKEFTDKHGKNILNAVHASDISYGISTRIAEEIEKQFFKGKSK